GARRAAGGKAARAWCRTRLSDPHDGSRPTLAASPLLSCRAFVLRRTFCRRIDDQSDTGRLCRRAGLAHRRGSFGRVQGRGISPLAAPALPVRYEPGRARHLRAGVRVTPGSRALLWQGNQGGALGPSRPARIPGGSAAGLESGRELAVGFLPPRVSGIRGVFLDRDRSGTGAALRRTGTVPGFGAEYLDLAAGRPLARSWPSGLRRRRGFRATGAGAFGLASLERA